MARVSVPLLSFRLLLFLCFSLMIVLSFFGGLILLEGEKGSDTMYRARALKRALALAGIPALVKKIAAGRSRTDAISSPAAALLSAPAITGLFYLQEKARNPVWQTPAQAAVIPSSVSSGIWRGTLAGRLFRDANTGRYLYPALYTYYRKKSAVVLQLRDRPGFLQQLLLSAEKTLQRASSGAFWYRPVALLAVMLLAALLLILSSTAVFLTRPVRVFTAMLETWNRSRPPGGRSLGLLRGSMKYVEELLNRESRNTLAAEPDLGQLLPVRQGYDFPGVDTAAFLIKRLEERKDFYDLLPLPEARLCIFRGEVSGYGHDASVATARMALAAQAYVRSFSDPARVVADLNSLFCSLYGSLAVNLFVGFLDITKKELLFSQAGGLPLFCFDKEDGNAVPYQLDIPPAGTIPPEIFQKRLQSGQLKLESGALLALFTEGLFKLTGFSWEHEAARRFVGQGGMGGKVLSFRNSVASAAESAGLKDDIAGLFVQLR